jgi:hypothetical protein
LQDETRVSGGALEHRAIPLVCQLADLLLGVVYGGLNLGAPFVEHFGGHFKSDDVGAVVVLEVMEVCVPLEVVLGETILNLLIVLGETVAMALALAEQHNCSQLQRAVLGSWPRRTCLAQSWKPMDSIISLQAVHW